MAVCAICAAGALAAPAAGAPAARGSSGGPAVFEASRAGGDVEGRPPAPRAAQHVRVHGGRLRERER